VAKRAKSSGQIPSTLQPAAARPSAHPDNSTPRTLAIVLGDQLDLDSPVLRDLIPGRDSVLMMEVAEESRHVPSHKQRTVLFLSAMRHFAAAFREKHPGVSLTYVTLDDPANTHSFSGEVARHISSLPARTRPQRIRLLEPGEHRVLALALGWFSLGINVDIVPDPHFLTSRAEFAAWANNTPIEHAAAEPASTPAKNAKPAKPAKPITSAKPRAALVMEYFYRWQRERLGILVNPDGTPVGGEWNLDKENRESFGKSGPSPRPPRPLRFAPDDITRGVIAAVEKILPDNPGSPRTLDTFGWPVTREHALECLRDFIAKRLPNFGPYEDAMWTDEPYVYHSLLSAPLNLKLLNPRECVAVALHAYEKGRAPLQSVEGFIRQIIGWREYIRGVYWLEGDAYAKRNTLDHTLPLPDLYWTGKTDMACLRACVGQVLDLGYGHHIQRLMVTGNFALTLGVHPKAISDWYLGMYVDAVDWATLPNTLGMSQHADAPGSGTDSQGRTSPRAGKPVVGTKPYISGGGYISRMSNYCSTCTFDPAKRTGDDACPFTVLYWDFLDRHRARFQKNPRMATVVKNLDRFGDAGLTQIRITAKSVRRRVGVEPANPPTPITPITPITPNTQTPSLFREQPS
jgi:deoxyribodipyrimidine photolyase-related protein